MSAREFDADVIIIGSGFGGSVAALRFAEAGHRVIVLERGDRVSRAHATADLDSFWLPRRGRFGANEFRPRGRYVMPWVAACVGGGSHLYAGTLKRDDALESFPSRITLEELGRYYEIAESMMGVTLYPDYPPYSEVPATKLLLEASARLEQEKKIAIDGRGRLPLAISYAPADGSAKPGDTFVNAHGAEQVYSDPGEQALLGGDVGAKNSLDLNYLFLAEKKHGVRIEPLVEADRFERKDGGWEVQARRYLPPRGVRGFWQRMRLTLFSSAWGPHEEVTFRSRYLVVAAGCLGSNQLLLRNRDVHRTLEGLSPRLGQGYATNGGSVSLLLPRPGKLAIGWLGFAAAVTGLALSQWWLLGLGAITYVAALASLGQASDPDIGTTNSEYTSFTGTDGKPTGVYIEGGRYPTPFRFALAMALSIAGVWKARRYRAIIRIAKLLRVIPPFALFAHSWPVPLLQMGRDTAVGRLSLDANGRARVDFPFRDNASFYGRQDELGRAYARAARGVWVPNLVTRLTKSFAVVHNVGGVPMGDDPSQGVVDHAGRVFGQPGLMVLDGAIFPRSPGLNPALTILALVERAMTYILTQHREKSSIEADS